MPYEADLQETSTACMPYMYASCVCFMWPPAKQIQQRARNACLICIPYMYALYLCRMTAFKGTRTVREYMYTFCVCLMYVAYTYALYICLVCMPHVYAFQGASTVREYMFAL